jgi:hypothetical protein
MPDSPAAIAGSGIVTKSTSGTVDETVAEAGHLR